MATALIILAYILCGICFAWETKMTLKKAADKSEVPKAYTYTFAALLWPFLLMWVGFAYVYTCINLKSK